MAYGSLATLSELEEHVLIALIVRCWKNCKQRLSQQVFHLIEKTYEHHVESHILWYWKLFEMDLRFAGPHCYQKAGRFRSYMTTISRVFYFN